MSENPEYIQTLVKINEAVSDIVRPPTTSAEQEAWRQPARDLLCATAPR